MEIRDHRIPSKTPRALNSPYKLPLSDGAREREFTSENNRLITMSINESRRNLLTVQAVHCTPVFDWTSNGTCRTGELGYVLRTGFLDAGGGQRREVCFAPKMYTRTLRRSCAERGFRWWGFNIGLATF